MSLSRAKLNFSHVERTTVEDIVYVANNIRQADADEIQASVGIPVLISLFRSWTSSWKTETIFNPEGMPVGIYGAVADNYGNSIVWMVATDGLIKIAKDFIKHCSPIIDNFNHTSPVLYNVVDARNHVHIRWLKKLGFKIINKHKYWGVEKRLFYKFVRIMPNV